MEINSETKILGIIGHPIKHSLSPVMHNAVFRELNLNCIYLAFDVENKKLGTTINAGKALNFLGLNVTIPHKISVIKFLDKVSREARFIGAVNTIKFENGKALGFNTDGIGCIRALEESGIGVRNKNILILGAGGAARAIAFQCLLEGADVSISNRTREKAIKLKDDIKRKLNKEIDILDFNSTAKPSKLRHQRCRINLRKEDLEGIDIIINSTSVGMHPKTNSTPLNSGLLNPDIAVMDIVYNPIETKLLKDANGVGCKTVNGVGMLVHQGAESLRILLDIKAPIEVMKKVVIRKLG